MPIFEFKCLECGQEFEILLKNREEANSVKCKFCGGRVERLMSVVNSIIKGDAGGPASTDKPRLAETHTCPTGTCSHLELPGYKR
ncbi:MAG: zinc ribbon domain-containing protein [Caldimicrobium sp.]|jgi:putative FmdB family regulatory protein|nr:zinc ribbon domain-containing protein [Caldimicrobium sp.]MCC6048310.1 zinc ribbon domain-containing protein [Thermodesulfobacterium sp.]